MAGTEDFVCRAASIQVRPGRGTSSSLSSIPRSAMLGISTMSGARDIRTGNLTSPGETERKGYWEPPHEEISSRLRVLASLSTA